MANAPLNAASAGKSLHVRDAAGKAVAGKWESNPNNATMLLFPVARNGNYQVAIDATLADTQQRKLGKAIKGIVLVQ